MRRFTTARALRSAEMQQQLDGALQAFRERLKALKAGAQSLERFRQLPVDTGAGEARLGEISTVVQRGNKVSIVAYDPRQVKRIQTALIQRLGLAATPGAHDAQTLSVQLPTLTADRQREQAALAKAAFDSFKSNHQNRQSVASIRARFLQPVKKQLQKDGCNKTEARKSAERIEKLAQDYAAKLKAAYAGFQ